MNSNYKLVPSDKEKQFFEGMSGIKFSEWQLLKNRVDETFANQKNQIEFDSNCYLEVSKRYKKG